MLDGDGMALREGGRFRGRGKGYLACYHCARRRETGMGGVSDGVLCFAASLENTLLSFTCAEYFMFAV
jgi:hypothetical protein